MCPNFLLSIFLRSIGTTYIGTFLLSWPHSKKSLQANALFLRVREGEREREERERVGERERERERQGE